MKKKTRIILGAAAALVLVVVIALLVLVARLDGIVRTTVEREGSSQLKLATTLRDADVSILGGSVTLDELAIANPQGYVDPHIFQLGQISVTVSYGELMDDPVRIRDININSPRLVIERGGAGLGDLAKINLRDMLSQLESGTENQTRLVISRLNVSGTQVVIRPNIQGLQPEYSVTIPDVTMTEIGTDDTGRTGTEIGRVVSDVALTLARRAAESSELPPELRALLAGDLESMIADYRQKLGAEVRQRLEAELGDLRQELGPEATAALEKLLQGDTSGGQQAVEATTQRLRDDLQREAERGISDLLGGRSATRPATRPSTRPAGQ